MELVSNVERIFVSLLLVKACPFLAKLFTSIECFSNRFEIAKLIEATIISGIIKS